jgi:hypothetical protein
MKPPIADVRTRYKASAMLGLKSIEMTIQKIGSFVNKPWLMADSK